MNRVFLLDGEVVERDEARREVRPPTADGGSLKVSKGGREYLLTPAKPADAREPQLVAELAEFPDAVVIQILDGCPGIIDGILLVFWPTRSRGAIETQRKAIWMKVDSLEKLIEVWKMDRYHAP